MKNIWHGWCVIVNLITNLQIFRKKTVRPTYSVTEVKTVM